MTLKLFLHPLSSFCHKALIGLYENDTPFESHTVELWDEALAAPFKAMWPIGKIPVLRDEARDRTVPEATIIIEYLARHYPGPSPLVPDDPDLAIQTRLRDRFYDLYLHTPMQKVVGDRLRPDGRGDPIGVAEARTQMRTALDMIERDMATKTWTMGEAFGMADCAAAPALFYADKVAPFRATHPNAAAYLDRLMARPSHARALKEAEPYFHMFPA